LKSSTKISLEKLGPPGIPGHLVIVDKLKGDTRTDQEQLRDQSERMFHVTAILSKTPLLDEDIDLSLAVERGGSYINASPDAVTSLIKTSLGNITLSHNSHRELARIEFECAAASQIGALGLFHTAVSPFLDHISYLANVPIHLARTECMDKKNNVHFYDYINPHPHVTLNPHEARIFTRVLPLYALYREAKNSGSPFYRFLCYYKILEGTYAHIRPEFFLEARTRAVKVVTEKEVVPDHEELRFSHGDQIGKSIKTVFDNRFTPQFRDEIAHYLLSDGAVLNVSDFNAVRRFGGELLAIELCARTVIGVQERYEAQLG